MNKNHAIVIVTNQFDPHADFVIGKLQEKNERVVRFNTDYIPDDIKAKINVGNNENDFLVHFPLSEQSISLKEIKSVWWRRPGILKSGHKELTGDESRFYKREMGQIWGGLWADLECFWINHPDDIRVAEWKLGQLRRAKKLGFHIPTTLITNQKSEIHAFLEQEKDIIYKVVADISVGGEQDGIANPERTSRMARTIKFTHDHLEHFEELETVWSMFQTYIPKKFEYRVTVIGSKVFAYRIDSQSHEKTKIDWRDVSVDLQYTLTSLPEDIERKCIELTSSYNLNYGAIDLIEAENGEFFFLEINPNGQYLWLEWETKNFPITDHLVKMLISGKRL